MPINSVGAHSCPDKDLFWGMTAGAVVVWIGVFALALYYTRTARGVPSGDEC